jgi:hypothetical protein
MALNKSNKRWIMAIILMMIAITLIDYLVNHHRYN